MIGAAEDSHNPNRKTRESATVSISLTEDFKTLAELKKRPEEVLRQVHETGRPVVITVDGKPDVVILGAATYERKLRAANLARLLAEGEASIQAGGARPAEEVFEELLRGDKEVPGGRRPPRTR
jgi:prevent-host-death family protein